MHLLALFCLLLVVTRTLSLGHANIQLPLRDTHNQRFLRNIRSTTTRTVNNIANTVVEQNLYTSYGPRCTTRAQCENLDRVNPTWKYRPTYLETFVPYGANILISYSDDDEGAGSNPALDRQQESKYGGAPGASTQASQSTLYTGIVVSVGSSVSAASSQLLPEGTRVYLSTRCVARWTVAAWQSTYGYEKSAAMAGKFVNGVDLNNGNGWAWGWHPTADVYAHTPRAYAVDSTPPFTEVSTVFGDITVGKGGYPGRAGDAWSGNEYQGGENMNQQSNYLVCPESDIIGVVNENNYPNLEDRHYLKASTAYRNIYGSQTPRNQQNNFLAYNVWVNDFPALRTGI